MLSVEEVEVIVTGYIKRLLEEQLGSGLFTLVPEKTASAIFGCFAGTDPESLRSACSGELQVGVTACLALHVSLVCDVLPRGDINRNAIVAAFMGAITEVSASIVGVAAMTTQADSGSRIDNNGCVPEFTPLDIDMIGLASTKLKEELKKVDPKSFSLPSICQVRYVHDWGNAPEWNEWLSKFKVEYSLLNPQLTPEDVSLLFGSLDQKLLQQSFLAGLEPSEAAQKMVIEFKEFQ